MIQGQTIKQRNQIMKPEINYRELKALNFSMIKTFDSDPVKFFEQFKLGKKRKDSRSTSLVIGDLVDFYLLECGGDEEVFNNRYSERFALYESVKGTGQVFLLADVLYETTMEYVNDDNVVTVTFEQQFKEAYEKIKAMGKYSNKTEKQVLEDFNKNGLAYYTYMVQNMNKIVVDVSLMDKAKKIGKMIKEDPFTKDLFNESENVENFSKFPIDWTYKSEGIEVKCKSEVDFMKICHDEKKIYLYDLKTTYDNEMFEQSYIKNKYYLQAAYYYLAVKEWAKENEMGDYEVIPMEFIVGDTSSNNRRPIRYKTSMEDLKRSLTKFSINGTVYRGIVELIDEICWCDHNNIWNCSKSIYENNGISTINIEYDK